MTLVGETGLGRDLDDWSVVANDLRRSPVQPQAAAVLADRDPVAGAKDTREMGGVDTHRLGELAETDPGADPGTQQLLGGGEPPGRPPAAAVVRRLARRRGEDLQREALRSEGRSRVGCSQLGGEAPSEPVEARAP